MSEVYIKEPPVNGKAVFRTTHGDLEMELWATETPKACRNFCQLILEGYFNGTIFHRVIKDFCIQGGDGTNTGDGGESIYGSPYPDEIHPRLKFRYRGMMGIASAGKGTKTNASQFFIVLNRTPSLDGKHTLFGKVVGQTVYNLARMSDLEVDKKDRPLDPPRVLRTELVWDPFGDLEPRRLPEPPMPIKSDEVHRRAPVRNKNKVSFGDEEGSDSDDDAGGAPAAKGKSAHDLLADPRLKKEAAYPESAQASRGGGSSGSTKRAAPDNDRGKAGLGAKKPARPASVQAPPSASESEEESEAADFGGSDEDDMPRRDNSAQVASDKRREEMLRLKREIANVRPDAEETKKTKKRGSALQELRAGYQSREPRIKAQGRDGKKKEAADMTSMLKSFKQRLHGAVAEHSTEEAQAKVDEKAKADDGTFAAIWREGDEAADEDWLGGGGLKFHVSADKAFKLDRDRAANTLEIFDPLAADGNHEVLADARKKHSEKCIPQRRRKHEVMKGKKEGEDEDRGWGR